MNGLKRVNVVEITAGPLAGRLALIPLGLRAGLAPHRLRLRNARYLFTNILADVGYGFALGYNAARNMHSPPMGVAAVSPFVSHQIVLRHGQFDEQEEW